MRFRIQKRSISIFLFCKLNSPCNRQNNDQQSDQKNHAFFSAEYLVYPSQDGVRLDQAKKQLQVAGQRVKEDFLLEIILEIGSWELDRL